MVHVPVLQKEVLEYLNPKPNENFIDATFGEGGHTAAILEKNKPRGKVLGIEIDPELYKKLKSRMAEFPISLNSEGITGSEATGLYSEFPSRLILVNDNYVNLKEIVKKEKIKPISGILFDLGISSWHLSESKRGFSFLRNEPLDMRYSPPVPNGRGSLNKIERQNSSRLPEPAAQAAGGQVTAEKILNFWSKEDIKNILREYGEERYAQIIVENIVGKRKIKPIRTTFQLIEIIKNAVPKKYLRSHVHFATRTFQALRIAVNDELNNFKEALPRALEILKSDGRLVIISFHSLEDRIVKNFFRERAKPRSENNLYYETKEGLPVPYFRQRRIVSGLKILTKKPIRPTPKEIKINPRSRSAKLRAAMKIANH